MTSLEYCKMYYSTVSKNTVDFKNVSEVPFNQMLYLIRKIPKMEVGSVITTMNGTDAKEYEQFGKDWASEYQVALRYQPEGQFNVVYKLEYVNDGELDAVVSMCSDMINNLIQGHIFSAMVGMPTIWDNAVIGYDVGDFIITESLTTKGHKMMTKTVVMLPINHVYKNGFLDEVEEEKEGEDNADLSDGRND